VVRSCNRSSGSPARDSETEARNRQAPHRHSRAFLPQSLPLHPPFPPTSVSWVLVRHSSGGRRMWHHIPRCGASADQRITRRRPPSQTEAPACGMQGCDQRARTCCSRRPGKIEVAALPWCSQPVFPRRIGALHPFVHGSRAGNRRGRDRGSSMQMQRAAD